MTSVQALQALRSTMVLQPAPVLATVVLQPASAAGTPAPDTFPITHFLSASAMATGQVGGGACLSCVTCGVEGRGER